MGFRIGPEERADPTNANGAWQPGELVGVQVSWGKKGCPQEWTWNLKGGGEEMGRCSS